MAERMRLEGRTAVITGAGGGIGRAITVSLARRGCHLALADIDEAGMAATLDRTRVYGIPVSRHRVDVADRAAVAEFPDIVAAEHPGVDVLINNAGVAVGGTFEQVSEEDFEWLFEINFWGLVRMTRAFLPLLRASADARVVNLSSVYGLIAPPEQAAYAASKFAVRGFSEALRHELEGLGVGVTVVHPGGVNTLGSHAYKGQRTCRGRRRRRDSNSGFAKAKMEVDMRKLIAGMKISVDGKIEGPEHGADWVEAWSEDYGLTPHIDACLLGGGMYPGYEQYWTGIQNEPDKPAWITGNAPTPAELEWARFIKQTPHYVLSNTLTSALWPNTSFVRRPEEIVALKQQPGKDIYLIGGARTTASLIDAGLVDELRFIVYPLIAGEGKALFATTEHRQALELQKVQQLQDGRLSLIYGIG